MWLGPDSVLNLYIISYTPHGKCIGTTLLPSHRGQDRLRERLAQTTEQSTCIPDSTIPFPVRAGALLITIWTFPPLFILPWEVREKETFHLWSKTNKMLSLDSILFYLMKFFFQTFPFLYLWSFILYSLFFMKKVWSVYPPLCKVTLRFWWFV